MFEFIGLCQIETTYTKSSKFYKHKPFYGLIIVNIMILNRLKLA